MSVNKITFYGFEQFTDINFMPKIVDFLKLQSKKRNGSELKKFAELMFSIKMDFRSHGEELPECLYCAEKQNQIVIIELKPVTANSSPIEFVEEMTKIFNPNMFVILAEAWSLDKEPMNGKRISEHSEKKECFIVDGRTLEGLAYSQFYSVVDKNGVKQYTKESVDNDQLSCSYDNPGER